MIELATVYRARAKCSRCGWVGDWRSSATWITTAEQRAAAQLQQHDDLWQPAA